MDLSFHHTVAPGKPKRSVDGIAISCKPSRERCEWRGRSGQAIVATLRHPRDYDRWLDREQTEQLPVDPLRPLDSDEMEMFEANPKVGNVRNNGPELLRAAVVAAEDGALPL